MRGSKLAVGLAVLAVGLGLGYPAAQAAPATGTYIVMLKPGAGISSVASQYRAQTKLEYTALGGFAATLDAEQARQLANDPRVSSVAPDGIARISDTQNNPTWGLDRVDQKNLPLDSKYTYNNKGDGATAYVVDTGVYFAHSEFGGRAKSGYDFIDNDADASDCHGHGTHVAGTIGSATYGLAKNTNIVAVRVLNCQGQGEWSQVIGGIDWVAKNGEKPGVLNMSLGGEANSSVDDAVKRAVAAGFVNAIAAGNNNGANACSYSPARTPEAITVAASDNNDNRSSFSNIGSCVDIFAPGSNITSTKNGGGTTQMSGTSMATPHVAGGSVLVLTANPSFTPAQVRDELVKLAADGVLKGTGSGSPNKLLNTQAIGGGTPPKCGAKTNDNDVSIPDAGSAVTSEIQNSGCDGNASATLPVRVDIDHTYTADLAVDLIAPSGAVISLQKPGGVGDASGIHTVFNVNASSESANGTWQLRIRDIYRFDSGTLTGWGITF